ncbi:GTP 3',8-cyclase [Fundidesulfovibrio magnetotacticus]|uniref:GTP 3',8-cyclase n=1 Tax=Fundidesulfovibrio magnetotacticus TaxID=2730080 RepID=A0A6V8LQZ6_9BACT|nr:radical SAM (seleno)protein TrsS [Fundidesulfovibrio magnetotacticus]GFK92186.1 GTP 3',8-cyclase [Fundidesulfovibrio magnetotacticus]
MPPQSAPPCPADTWSLCPVCLKRLPARRATHGDCVFLERTCPDHGHFRVPVWVGEPALSSWRRPKTPSPPNPGGETGRGCPYDCGLCAAHAQHTCTALVEVTGRCDLCCPVCFADSGHGASADPSLEALRRRLVALRLQAGACNLQLSGGEPTVRDDLPEIVAAAREARFAFVQLNTNGLRLAREHGYAARLARAGLASVFLQFDGSDAACAALRGRALLSEKLAAVEACARAGLGVVLVPTVARGVNEGELGAILALALSLAPGVRGVHFQPMAAFGRRPGKPGERGLHGPTLPETLRLLVAQSEGLLRAEHFHPPGCEHAMCSFSGTFLREGHGLKPLGDAAGGCCPEPSPQVPSALEGATASRAFTARQWAAPPPEPAPGLAADDFDRFLAQAGSSNRFSISCMAFQDAWTVDLERLRGCCIHVSQPDGGLIPFCALNIVSSTGRPLHREGGLP